jgi:hypothetical protein
MDKISERKNKLQNSTTYPSPAPPGGSTLRWTQGGYDCEYIKERGKWKFSSMKYVVLFPEQTELWPKITDSTYIKV